MGKMKQRKRRSRMKSRVFQHKMSVLAVSGVVLMLTVVLSVISISKHEKNEALKARELEIQAQLDAQEEREEEIAALEEYVGTDEYVEDVAKEKLGLVNPNEILFKAEP